ncbi:IS3 family transposase [Pseudorhodobacter turbinis]|uniref:IS3 family transposase n=1 Tax=Pseudorhodobacter turbinis TaxID=2500533 RepID=A0A4P8ECN6_9RHOB|nr:IS3 family transposase [Pseudorhodobacter turbinis]QCO54542.1 IS3 family transposase [Pseudorhodobacter turbinis]QCO55018.1 IS3 family transposase [Pseudorhodobacter turbinis]
MATRYTDEFRRDAVRIAVTSGLTRPQVASDLGVGLSTLNKWVQKHQHDDLMSGPHEDVEKENARLRKEVRLLREEREVLKKAGNLLCGPKPMRFAFVDAWKEVWPVKFLCRIMQVTSRGFRAWRSRPMSRRQRDDMVILAHIREQHRLSLQTYGRPRMTEELQELGLQVGHRRVGRLMRENDIKIIRSQKYKATTDSNHTFNIAPNLLDQNFSADGPNQKWAGDISYIWTSEGWLYLAVILDLYSRRVIGWAVSNRMKRDLAIRALDMAVALRQPPKGCIHHTDRGSQYCSHDYQKRLSEHGFKVSMSGKGNCYDNSMVETFFKSIKAELIWRNRWETRRQAEGAIFQYINGFYNPRRRHSSLGGKSPLAFERKAA